MVKKVLLLAVLALALPLAAFASGAVDFTNTGGTLTGGSAGLSLSGSALTVVNGLNGGGLITGSNLGSVSFTTGAFVGGGNAQTGGTLAAGGSFMIVGNGVNGVPTGTIFSGTFTSATWEMITLANGNHEYALIGAIAGTLGNFSTNGATSQLTIVVDTHKGYFNGSAGLASGDTSVVVPEPGTLTLLGTGLIGLAGVIRRKLNLV